MFDWLRWLLNSKFYNKCKHAIKCTQTRLDWARRRKETLVEFLKKDIADLLAMGLEQHAFGRVEGLIVDMNQLCCYDMIEQYCMDIVKQLYHLQKQSECPQELFEPVSSLILAASRFGDLHELRVLRDMFTKRYGKSVELFVSFEFVQKLEDTSFTNEEKLQMMQSIAEEFSVPLNTNALEWKISGVLQNRHDLQQKSSYKWVEVEASSHNALKIDSHAVHERKYKVTPKVHGKKQEVQIKPKDIHVISDAIGQLGDKSMKKHSDIRYAVSLSNLKQINNQEELRKDNRRELMDYAEKIVVPAYNEPEEAEKKDAAEKADGKGYHIHRSCMVGDIDHKWGHADMGLKTLGIEKQGFESTSSLNGKTLNKAPPYSKPYRSINEKSAKEDNDLYNRPNDVAKYEHYVQHMQKIPEKAINKRPPYVKPNYTYRAANGYKYAGTRETGHRRDGLTDVDALQPVSIRRKNDEEAMMTNQTHGGRRRNSSKRNGSDGFDQRGGYLQPQDGGGINDAVNNARHFQQISERRKRGSKQSGSASGSNYESEEDETDNGRIDVGYLFDELAVRVRALTKDAELGAATILN